MKELNVNALRSFREAGHRYLLYINLKTFALIVPLISENWDTSNVSYIIPIDDDQTREMAAGVDGFQFYYFTPLSNETVVK